MSDVKEVYTVVPVGEGCSHCNAGEHWDVVFKFGSEEEMALSTSYGDKEQAEDIARDCNDAYAKGIAQQDAEIERLKAAINKHHSCVWGDGLVDHGADADLYAALGTDHALQPTQASEGQELLPCPFCGSTKLDVVLDEIYYVTCDTEACGADGPYSANRERAIEKWNRRSGSSAKSE